MTEPENFLARWSRRKLVADEPPAAADAAPASSPEDKDGQKTESSAPRDAATDAATTPFDPASLPSIDSIGAQTDITAFLKPGVPGDLRLAALRRAWVTDPAIRDFKGLAENDWDFTVPNSTMGFGEIDPGLDQAIRAAGSVSELARLLGISQPSVSNWTRVPAERVTSVESLTGVNRVVLRPDLFGEARMSVTVDEIDAARAQEYALLAALLVRAPDAALLKRLAGLRGDESPLGMAHIALAEAAANATTQQVEREYFDLFIGVGRGELMPYGSYYLTGFLHERPLARLRDDLGKIGIERVEGNVEPEDHAATLCEIMAGIIGGQFDAHPGSDQEIFEKHMAPWIGRFFRDLEAAEAAKFYRPVGTIGRLLLDIETEAFALNA